MLAILGILKPHYLRRTQASFLVMDGKTLTYFLDFKNQDQFRLTFRVDSTVTEGLKHRDAVHAIFNSLFKYLL